MRKRFVFVPVLLLAITFVGCTTKNPATSNQTEPHGSSWYAKGLVESDNQFGIKLFKEIVREERDTNIFVSPLSVSMSLGMTYNGAN